MENGSNIVRTATRLEGELTPEELEQMKAHSQLWRERACRTEPIEPGKIIPAIKGIYRDAGLKEPAVVIVPSPLVMAVAGGFAAAICYARRNKDSKDKYLNGMAPETAWHTMVAEFGHYKVTSASSRATSDATYRQTIGATRAATDAVTDHVTWAAIDAANPDPTRGGDPINGPLNEALFYAITGEINGSMSIRDGIAASSQVTGATSAEIGLIHLVYASISATDAVAEAITQATAAATSAATDVVIDAATPNTTLSGGWAVRLAQAIAEDDPELLELMLGCALRWTHSYQQGNRLVGQISDLTAARDVLGLKLPEHRNFADWEKATIHGGYRWMHEEFCIVSDFPEVQTFDDRHRPHGQTGPCQRWRDGYSIYYWHGVRIYDTDIIDHPERITVAQIDAERNTEIRRVMTERYGLARYLQDSGATAIQSDDFGTLYMKTQGNDEPLMMVKVVNSTPEGVWKTVAGKQEFEQELRDGVPYCKDYFIRVPPTMRTAREAVAWTFGMTGNEYQPVEQS